MAATLQSRGTMKLNRSKLALAALLVLAIFGCDWEIAATLSPGNLSNGVARAQQFLSAFASPDLSSETLAQTATLAKQTLSIAFLGTALGVVIGYVLAVFASRAVIAGNNAAHRPSAPQFAVLQIARTLLDILRGIPDFAWALLILTIPGPGPVTGILALALSVGGMLGKVYSELWDRIETHRYRSTANLSSSRLLTFAYGIQPIAARDMLSYTMLRAECSVRNASVIGVVGGGGLGGQLFDEFGFANYGKVVTLLCALLLLTAGTEIVATWVRKVLQRSGRQGSHNAVRCQPMPVVINNTDNNTNQRSNVKAKVKDATTAASDSLTNTDDSTNESSNAKAKVKDASVIPAHPLTNTGNSINGSSTAKTKVKYTGITPSPSPLSANLALPCTLLLVAIATALWPLLPALEQSRQELQRIEWSWLAEQLAQLLSLDLSLETLSEAAQSVVAPVALATISTLVATSLATVAAFTGSAAFQLAPHKLVGGTTNQLTRLVGIGLLGITRTTALVLRAIPEVAWLLIFASALSLGLLPAAIALSFHTTGVLARVYLETVDNLPATQLSQPKLPTPLHHFLYLAIPRAKERWKTYSLFQFETNIRAGLTLGIVGAGGLGDLLHSSMSYWNLPRVGTLLVVMVGLTTMVDRLVRSR